MNGSVNLIKDANPKVAILALGCVDQLIKNYRDEFQPLVNMSFDLLLNKLGDGKVGIFVLIFQLCQRLITC